MVESQVVVCLSVEYAIDENLNDRLEFVFKTTSGHDGQVLESLKSFQCAIVPREVGLYLGNQTT